MRIRQKQSKKQELWGLTGTCRRMQRGGPAPARQAGPAASSTYLLPETCGKENISPQACCQGADRLGRSCGWATAALGKGRQGCSSAPAASSQVPAGTQHPRWGDKLLLRAPLPGSPTMSLLPPSASDTHSGVITRVHPPLA